ncbi:MAG: InlB B-repeat-containing protein [Treponema sp.]|nr:InlB B-repeat-containing protein [Treponema sp.]
MKKTIFLFFIVLLFISCQTDYIPQKFTVTFDSDGGTRISSQEIEEGNSAQKPEDPEKDDYDFAGWYNGESLFDFSTPISSPITLKAKWSVKTYTVTFDSDGGSEIATKNIEIHKTLTKPEDPTKENYDFLGWYIDESLFDFSTSITSNITLKAKWSIKTYTVTFDSDGGNEVTSQIIEVNNTLKQTNDPKKDDYTFLGWYIDETLFDFSTPITSNITLKAKWSKNVFIITFDSAGGTNINSQTLKKGQTITKPDNPERTGYIFNGWYFEETPFDFSLPITSKITLIAKWNPNQYTITFDKTSGTGQDMQNQTLLYDEEMSLPANSYTAPIGKKFAGWAIRSDSSSIIYKDKQIIKNLSSENDSSITLYAVWVEKDSHSIRYWNIDFTGETIDNSENPKKYFESQNVELKNIERNGYNFEGWFTDANCSDSNKVTGWKAGEQTTDFLFYAKWTPINYTITYENIEGATNPNPATYIITDDWNLKHPEKLGYSFIGWKYGDKQIKKISETSGGNVTLTAQWEILKYDLYYILGDYTSEYQQYTIEDDITLMIPSKKGYTFGGWFENDDFVSSEEQITGWHKGEKTGRLFFNAKWIPKSYTIKFDSCGGTTVSSQVISYNSVTTKPEDPVYNDYTFMGWYFDSEQKNFCDFSKAFTFPVSIEDTEVVTLYAKWGKFVYVEGATVIYNTKEEEIWKLLPEGEEIPLNWNDYRKEVIQKLYICDHELTQAEYLKYCSYSGKTNDEKPKEDLYKPVTYVTWNDAIVYCNLRSISEGLSPAYSLNGKTNPLEWQGIIGNESSKYCGGTNYWDDITCDFTTNGYRLPTVIEWEYIAREGSTLSRYKYSGSNNIDDVAWYKNNSDNDTHYGKLKCPNSLEIYDMSGNVDEWCWDQNEKYHSLNNISYLAAVKGGNYTSSTNTASTKDLQVVEYAYKQMNRNKQYNYIGFRIVRTATE